VGLPCFSSQSKDQCLSQQMRDTSKSYHVGGVGRRLLVLLAAATSKTGPHHYYRFRLTRLCLRLGTAPHARDHTTLTSATAIACRGNSSRLLRENTATLEGKTPMLSRDKTSKSDMVYEVRSSQDKDERLSGDTEQRPCTEYVCTMYVQLPCGRRPANDEPAIHH
jgi:hypothetical protein